MKIPKTFKIKKCRLCKNKKLKQIYNFGNHYVSNFVNKSSIKKGIKAPLNLVYCKNCELLQLEHSAPQEIMYKKFYWYKSGITKTMRDGLKELYYDIKKNCKIKSGDVILLTDMEHHSNIIPWQIICKKTGAKIKYIRSTKNGTINLEDLKKSLDSNVKIVSITHASNVFGTINPVKEITNIVKKNGSKIMIDGCQSIPHMKVNVKDLDCDFYAFSGHKMFGPTGVGVLYGKEEILEEMQPYQTGGGIIETVTMTESTWTSIPHKFEPGSPMAAQVIALAEAVDYLEACLEKHDNSLNEYSLIYKLLYI